MATTKKPAAPPPAPAAPAPAWTAPAPATPYPAYQAQPGAYSPPPVRSGMLKAGTILMLVGAILHAVGAFFLLVISLFMFGLGGALGAEEGGFVVGALVGGIYLGLGIVLAVGSWFGFSSWKRTWDRRGGSSTRRGSTGSSRPFSPRCRS